ncbi:DNA repair-scaffolding protein [Pelodytes ibericus]
MPQGKRKRSTDRVYALFPVEDRCGGKNTTADSVPEPSSLNKAWDRCGEGFDGCRTHKGIKSSERKTSAVRQLAGSFVSDEVSGSLKDPADIMWSSSDSDLSNDGNQELYLQSDGESSQNSPKSNCNSLSLFCRKAEEYPVIDWQNVSDHSCDEKCSIVDASESAVDISDAESSSSCFSSALLQRDGSSSKAIEIAEYSSDDLDESVSLAGRSDCPVSGKGVIVPLVGKSASDWLRTAQVLLKTPDKAATKACKTPEDSAKKRKRFLGGGLAERLNRLQNRERSAISFWRHQCDSDFKMPLGDKSGVLVLKVLEVHEECSMHVALCQKLVDSQNAEPTECNLPSMLKVLFTRQTAAHIKGQPCDIIHIHPPWLSIFLKDENISVILNTHFSQRIVGSQEGDTVNITSSLLPERRKPVPLSLPFKINNVEHSRQSTCEEKPKVSHGLPLASSTTVNDSLLDVVETKGAAGWKETCIQVVVQRVYALPARDSHGHLLQGTSKTIPSTISTSDRSDIRLCLLIQDSYGIFSELELQSNSATAADIERYSTRFEGKLCCLSGMKILQRTTRGRAPGLFSLIDSLWPPLVPIKIHGQSHGQMQPNLPSPSFCYILAVRFDEKSDSIREEDKISDFYLPPVSHSLEDILQVVGPNQRCSFWATVIYVKPEQIDSDFPLQKDIWMFVTDATLQVIPASSSLPRVLAVCVSSSCVLESGLLHALCKELPCLVWFKDAIKENGRIICVERTVLSLQKPFLSCAPGVNELIGPVILDELDSTTEANSLCFVKGTVVGVNERAAFSWPVCNLCGSNRLQHSALDSVSSPRSFFCVHCSQEIHSPITKMQLEVFLHCELRPRCNVKLKLQQKTISLLLSFCSSEDGRYDGSGVTGRELGPLNCYVQSGSNYPNSPVALEEIPLVHAASSESG